VVGQTVKKVKGLKVNLGVLRPKCN